MKILSLYLVPGHKELCYSLDNITEYGTIREDGRSWVYVLDFMGRYSKFL